MSSGDYGYVNADFSMVNEAFITGDLLRWARERRGLTYADLAQHLRVSLDVIRQWEDEESYPPLGKAQELAHFLRIPFGYLFLSKRPSDEAPIPDFRTVSDKGPSALSPDFIDILNQVLLKQEWYREYCEQDSVKKLGFVGHFRGAVNVDRVAQSIKEQLFLDDGALRRNCRDWGAYLALLSRTAQDAGVLVMRSGIVGSDTTRPLDVAEFRGFALADAIAPVVFINAKDAVSAQIFTLIHELAHIWINQSGISNPDPSELQAHRFEEFCNKVAAEVLVPADDFLAAWSSVIDVDAFPTKFARTFLVSPLVVIRRAFELRAIGERDFFRLVKREKSKPIPMRKPGGDALRMLLSRNSHRLTIGVLGAVRQNRLMYRDAAKLLGVSDARVPQLLRKRID
jgi:Zn-dependent peptidase ImmA (M78 family)/transcriptional regulator with XRE-family HTH domain